MMHRKGFALQVFFVVFFALLVVLSMLLLMMQKDNLEAYRPSLAIDLYHQEGAMVTTTLLRSPIETPIASAVTVADLIIINTDGRYTGDEKDPQRKMSTMAYELDLAMPDEYYYEITITYPGKTEYGFKNTEFYGPFKKALRENDKDGLEGIVEKTSINSHPEEVPRSRNVVLLPSGQGNIEVVVYLSERQ